MCCVIWRPSELRVAVDLIKNVDHSGVTLHWKRPCIEKYRFIRRILDRNRTRLAAECVDTAWTLARPYQRTRPARRLISVYLTYLLHGAESFLSS